MKIDVKDFNLYYGDFHALKNINIGMPEHEVSALIGPSGCGKSTLLKSLNRMNDLVPGVKITGRAALDGVDIYGNIDVNDLRRRVGMVFQKPNPFPMSVYDNVAYGPRTHGIRARGELDAIVEKSLRQAAIWDELKDRLKKSALALSGGQQQRLCIARALAVAPEVLLMDEPTSALDPISTSRIEDLINELKESVHNSYSHAQHAAGRAHKRPDGVLPARRDGGMRAHAGHIRASRRQAHGGLYNWTFRLIGLF